LQHDGLITIQARRISVLDYDALRRTAEFHRGYLHVPAAAGEGAPLIL
jgi:hypothetical protein